MRVEWKIIAGVSCCSQSTLDLLGSRNPLAAAIIEHGNNYISTKSRPGKNKHKKSSLDFHTDFYSHKIYTVEHKTSLNL
jgi:hypothetical protein